MLTKEPQDRQTTDMIMNLRHQSCDLLGSWMEHNTHSGIFTHILNSPGNDDSYGKYH